MYAVRCMAVCAGCRSNVEDLARFCPHCGIPLVPVPRRLGPGAELAVEDFGKAVLGHELGEGGMGIVYRAWLYYDPNGRLAGTPAHPVAVKVLHPLLRGKERARTMFRREAEALRRLAHPNIVHFFALTENRDHLALVMELVHGEPLSTVLFRAAQARPSPRAPCIPLALAWHTFAQLLGALAAVHALGILHRDVKPANVIVRPDGVVKLTDFGIARIPAEEAAATGGLAPGTGAYMSPEAVRGDRQDARSDLYSAAIVLYEMLAGRTPFDSPERSELMVRTAQLEDAPEPLSGLLDGAPVVLDVLMARALAKNPALRPASAVEFGDAFRAAFDLPATPGWSAQKELAELAKTLSGLEMPALPPTAPDPTVPDPVAERAAELRQDVLRSYTQPGGEEPAESKDSERR
ncbi:MAG TPA: serine/threonine-protein kinase [Polyangiaceae bacterium]|nr:serine/threonine-protein kinase [Polyangiaceae bacterium]